MDDSAENGQEDEGYVSEGQEDERNVKLKSKVNVLRFFKSATKSIG